MHAGAFGEEICDPVAYLMMNDPDLTAETEVQISRMPGMVTVGWHRKYIERRTLGRREWTNHGSAIYEADSIVGECAGLADGVRTEW